VKTVVIHIYHPDFALWNFPDELGERWSRRFSVHGLAMAVVKGREAFLESLPEAQALIGGGLNRETFPRARQLEWIQTASAGVGHLLFDELVESEVVVTNARGVHAIPMAEHLLGLMLSLVRKLHRSRDFQNKREWSQETQWREEPYFEELGGQTLGIVGLGAVGDELARRARALDMRVIAIRRRPEASAVVDEVRGEDELPWLLQQSDFIANCLPLTSRTRHFFDAEAFSKTKRGAFFLNVGRGKTVEETALIAALESGQLAGAGLDVTYEEPLPGVSPLYSLPQVVLSPHTSGSSVRFWERAATLFEENLERFAAGRPLRNVVDKREGY
jgi:phosphoglycerate dehydrogenase-like enzyme